MSSQRQILDLTNTTASKPEEKYCQWKDYIPDHLSLECEECNLYNWHHYVGLTGLTERELQSANEDAH